MTCIAGLRADDGSVWIGGDSAGVGYGYNLQIRADEKVFINGGFLFGFTTSFRMGQVLRYAFRPPKRYPDQDLMAYMVTDFMDAVREALKKAGFASKDKEAEEGGTFLVGHAGRLFSIYDDYQVGEVACGYAAVGCGDFLALGALHVNGGLPPEDRIRQALSAAEAHSAGVSGPFTVLSLPAEAKAA